MMTRLQISKIFLALLCTFVLLGTGCSKGCKSALQDLLAKKQATAPTKDQQEILPSPPAEKPEEEELTGEEDKTKDLDVESLEDEEDSEEIPSDKEGEEILPPDSEARQPGDGGGGTGIEGEPEGEKEGEPTEEGGEEKPEKEGEPGEEKPEDEGAAPDSDTALTQPYEIGLEDVTVFETATNFAVPVNAYYDSSLSNSFAFYDILVKFDPMVVNVDCGGIPASGSSGVFGTPGPEFDSSPTVPFCDNVAGQVRLYAVQGSNAYSPINFFNLASINFIRVGSAGTGTDLTITLIDYCNYDGLCFGTGDIPNGYPHPVWPWFVKDGRVDIVAPLPPVLDKVCDTAEPLDCNPAHVPNLTAVSIDTRGSKFDCAGGVTVELTGACNPIAPGVITNCTGNNLIVWGSIILNAPGPGSCCDVRVKNNASGLWSEYCSGCLCVK